MRIRVRVRVRTRVGGGVSVGVSVRDRVRVTGERVMPVSFERLVLRLRLAFGLLLGSGSV